MRYGLGLHRFSKFFGWRLGIFFFRLSQLIPRCRLWLLIRKIRRGVAAQRCNRSIFCFIKRDSATRFSTSCFFHKSVSPKPLSISNFVENSRRYSQLKANHRCRWQRWQMEKIFYRRSFNYFFTLWVVELTYRQIVHLKVPAVWIPIICHRCRWYRWCTFTGEYLREFSKKFETTPFFFRGLGENDLWKNLKQKNSWHCPFEES